MANSDPDSDLDPSSTPESQPQARPGTNPSAPSASHYVAELPYAEELQAMLEGRYLVESFLGQGGMGAVYRGLQMPLKRPVAIKILQKQTTPDDFGFEERFKREAYAMASLTHPHIVQVYDCGDAGESWLFISMELVDGGDLSDAIKAGQCTPEVALKLILQICDGLQAAHDRGIVHRDIKPANIFLTADGRAKVADFGLAKKFDVKGTLVTKTGLGMGTPDYAAPEQYEGVSDIDHRADLYALGVMFYQMLTGTLPRGMFKPASQRVAVDPRLDDVVGKAMATDRHERYQSAAEMKADIQQILSTWFAAPRAQAPSAARTGAVPAATPTQTGRAPTAARPAAPRSTVASSPPPPPSPEKSSAGMIVVVLGVIAALAVGAFFLMKKPAGSAGPSGASGSPSGAQGPVSAAELEAFSREVAAAATPEQQLALVEQKIESINGKRVKLIPTIREGRVVGLTVQSDGEGDVPDLWPVGALKDLTRLQAYYVGANDLSYLRDLKLQALTIHRGRFPDLTPLRDMPLTEFGLRDAPDYDYSVLSGKAITSLDLTLTGLTSIAFVKGMPLTKLLIDRTRVTDLSPLRGLPLKELKCDFVAARDTEILRSLTTLTKINDLPAAEFWAKVGGGSAPQPSPSAPVPGAAGTPLAQSAPPVPSEWKNLWNAQRDKALKEGKLVEEDGRWRATSALSYWTNAPYRDAAVRVTAANGTGLQLILRNDREGRMYRLMVQGRAQPHVRLEVFDNKTQTIVRELARAPLPKESDPAAEHQYHFAMVGDTMRAWVDSALVIEGKDEELTTGNAGYYVATGVAMKFAQYADLTGAPAFTTPAPASLASAQAKTQAPPPGVPAPAAAAAPAMPSPAAPAGTQAPTDPRLAQLESGFRARLEAEALKPHLTAVSSLDLSYVANGIGRARTAAVQRGVLDEVTALDAEKARIEKNEALPPTDPDTLPASLKTLRSTYRTALAKLEAERDRKAAPLYDLYLRALDVYISDLTKENKIDEAKKVTALRGDIAAQKPQDGAASTAAATPDSRTRPGHANPGMTPPPVADKGDDDAGGRASRWYEAARWVVSVGGTLLADKNGQQVRVVKESDIPAGRFAILNVDIGSNPKSAGIKAGDFARFSELKEFRFIRLANLNVGDEALSFLSTTPAVEGIVLSGLPITDAIVAHLTPLTQLTELQIQRAPQFTGKGIEKLVSLPSLKTVWFNGTGAGDACAKALAGAKALQYVRFDSTAITDAGLAALGALPNLREAFFTTCKQVEGKTLDSWTNTASLQSLDLSGCALDAKVLPVIAKFTNLTRLELNDLPVLDDRSLPVLNPLGKVTSFAAMRSSITGASFTELTGWKSLTKLMLNYETPISAKGLAAIVTALPKLEELHLGAGAKLSGADLQPLSRLPGLKILVLPVFLEDAGLAEIARIASLERLILNESSVTGKGIAALKPLKALTSLTLAQCREVDDHAIPALQELKGLKELIIRGTSITADGAADLQKSLPGCNVISK